jgi:hypothetical protein
MAAALIDRLLHHCHIVNIRGNSFRMRHHEALQRDLRSALTPHMGDGGNKSKGRNARREALAS